MPKSDDINALYDQFSGNVNSFREIGRTARVAEAHSRWPLFSHMAQELGASVPSAGDQTPSVATQRHQDEPAPQLTPPEAKPALPLVLLQSAKEALVPDLHDIACTSVLQAPSVRKVSIQPASAPIAPPPTASLVTPPGALSKITEPTALGFGSNWLQAFAAQPTLAPSLKPVALPKIPSAAVSQTPAPAPAPAFLPVSEASPRVGTSPLRRLIRAEPPILGSKDTQPAEDLASVFFRLAGRSGR